MDIADDITLSNSDRRILEKLRGFLPEKVFDAHAHLYDGKYLPNMCAPGTMFEKCGPVVDKERFLELQGLLYPGAIKIRLNQITAPDLSMKDLTNGHRGLSNEFLVDYLNMTPEDVGQAFVLPCDTDDDIEKLLRHPRIKGLKCYHVAANKKITWQANIDEYLPESAWRVANEHGLCITLHMVKDAALADPENTETIRKKARQYPNAKLILAHAARGFAAWTAIEGLKSFSDFSNIYFDTAAVCEPTAIFAVIKAAGVKRVLWGSDFPISMYRGKCISFSDKFLWLYRPMLASLSDPVAAEANLIGVENLSALAQACDMLDLAQGDVEDIFYNNAMDLFGLAD